MAFQSCAAGIVNIIEGAGGSSGTAGILVAILMLSGGIVSIATCNSKKKGGDIALIVLFGLAALFVGYRNYSDLVIPKENEESLLREEKPFSAYIKKLVKEKNLRQQDIFIQADIPAISLMLIYFHKYMAVLGKNKILTLQSFTDIIGFTIRVKAVY